jgi:ankyrin repeat protein
VEALLKRGADVNKADTETGRSCLHEALISKNSQIATLLVDKGHISLSIRDHNLSETALHFAIRSITTTQDILLCSHLLDRSDPVTLNMPDKSGNTILHIAAIRSVAPKSSTALIETILAYKVDPTIKNNSSMTALDILSKCENTKLIDMVRRYTLSHMASQSPTVPVKKEPEEICKKNIIYFMVTRYSSCK